MATFAALAGVELPGRDRDGKPTTFDSHDMSPILLGTGKSERDSWYYFTERELSPGAIMGQQLQKITDSFVKYPPRPVQSETYAGPMSITRFRTIQEAKKLMKQKKIELPELN